MGSFVVYVLEWALCLSAFLLLYKMCFSGSTFHRFNRMFLLGSVVVAALLPLIHITPNEQMEPIAEVCRLSAIDNAQLTINNSVFTAESAESTTLAPHLSPIQKVFIVLTLTYLGEAWLRASIRRRSPLARRNSSKVMGYIYIEWILPTPNVGMSSRTNSSSEPATTTCSSGMSSLK